MAPEYVVATVQEHTRSVGAHHLSLSPYSCSSDERSRLSSSAPVDVTQLPVVLGAVEEGAMLVVAADVVAVHAQRVNIELVRPQVI